jgi:hypothetical protein
MGAGAIGCWFDGADEAANELAINLSCELIHVGALSSQKVLRIVDGVDARDFNIGVLETGRGKLREVFLIGQGACHAADPELNAFLDGGWHFSAYHDVVVGDNYLVRSTTTILAG